MMMMTMTVVVAAYVLSVCLSVCLACQQQPLKKTAKFKWWKNRGRSRLFEAVEAAAAIAIHYGNTYVVTTSKNDFRGRSRLFEVVEAAAIAIHTVIRM
jgi:hypothetical protein